MPPLAAFIIKVLSAALSLLPALAAPFAGAAVAFGASALAPVFSGGYAFSALLVVARQSAPAPSATIAIREMVRFLFISVCRLVAAIDIRGSHLDPALDVRATQLFEIARSTSAASGFAATTIYRF